MVNPKFCDCVDFCARSGKFEDGSGEWFLPYVPSFVEGSPHPNCRRIMEPKRMRVPIVEKPE